jgi:DNA-binding Lrp family transcriptional regulator
MITELEKKILKSLNQNARKSLRKIAKEAGVSTTSIYNNVRKLEQKGILKGYIPLVDEELLGFQLIALIGIRINQSNLMEVEEKMAQHPEVRAIYDITGEWDAILVCYFKDRKDLDMFLKNQLAVPHVERVITNIVLNVLKDDKRTPVI